MTAHDDPLAKLWQSGEASLAPLPLEEVKRRAATFGDVVARRNRREYGAAAFVVIVFALYAVFLPGTLLKTGSVLVIAGALFVGWQLARRTSRPNPEAEAADVRAFYRSRLVAEEHMLARVGGWYIAPMLPGLLVFLAGTATPARFGPIAATLVVAVPALLIFAGIWWLNHRAAARLRDQIARLDAPTSFEGEN